MILSYVLSFLLFDSRFSLVDCWYSNDPKAFWISTKRVHISELPFFLRALSKVGGEGSERTKRREKKGNIIRPRRS